MSVIKISNVKNHLPDLIKITIKNKSNTFKVNK